MDSQPLIDRTLADLAAANAGRNPDRLATKYDKMAESPFIFLRGACHLFYPGLPDTPLFREAPLAWSCGDLHFENFGSFKADNRQVYFDINDFDEGALAPASWDVARLLTSLLAGADALKATASEALAAAAACLQAYREALAEGKPLWVDPRTAEGLVGALMDSLSDRSRLSHLEKRTKRKDDGTRKLKKDGEKILSLGDQGRQADKAKVEGFMADFAQRQPNPDFYRVLDVAERVAGTGSLGLERYIILVEGKGSPDGNYLLDLKACRPSALLPSLAQWGIEQPAWGSESERVAAIQGRMQAMSPAFLRAVMLGGKAFLLRGLQATEDRVAVEKWKHLDELKAVAATFGRILAWDQLRAAGRQGAANADALMDFGARTDWQEAMLGTAMALHQCNQAQWRVFIESRGKGN